MQAVSNCDKVSRNSHCWARPPPGHLDGPSGDPDIYTHPIAHRPGEPLPAVAPALASPGPAPLRHAVPFPKRQPSCRRTWCGDGDLWACWPSLAEAVSYDTWPDAVRPRCALRSF